MGSHGSLSIPIVDIAKLFDSPKDSRAYREAAERLARACRINGGVGISGHGLPPKLLREAFDVNKALFDLPYEQKMKAPHPEGLWPHRGYSGPGKESLAGSAAVKMENGSLKQQLKSTIDHKETYELGSDFNKDDYNIWLPEDVLPGFREFTIRLYWELTGFTQTLIDALAVGAGFDEKEREYTAGLHTGYDSAIRLLHYPSSQLGKFEQGGRLGAHTDWGLFTILFQDAVGGLEFQDLKSGQYMSALPQDDVIYLNIGDSLTRITNGFYPACVHRVTSASAQSSAQRESGEVPERHSIAYFVGPDPDALIYAQPSRIIADKCMKYEPVVFQTYSTKLFSAARKGVY